MSETIPNPRHESPEIKSSSERGDQVEGTRQTPNLPSIREAAMDMSRVGQSREEQKRQLDALVQRYGAVGFIDKFQRQKERREGGRNEQTFEVGEKVGARFVVQQVRTPDGKIDKTKLELLVDGNVTGDIRNSDMFIVDVSPEDWEAAQQFAGMPFNGIVEVTGNEQYVASNMYRYPARAEHLECAVPVNPEVQEMQEGTSVLVEGEIESFEITDYWDYKDEKKPKTAIIQVKTSDGHTIPVEIDPNVQFEPSPAMENIRDKVPEVGDTVRIRATVLKQGDRDEQAYADVGNRDPFRGTEGQRRIGTASADKKLYAPWCCSTYLLKPSERRQNEFESLRASVETKLGELGTALQSSDYAAARLSIGKIMKDEMNEGERAQLETLVATIPENERPLMLWERYEAIALNKSYNTDIDSMTKQEFYEFMKAAVQKPFTDTEMNGKGDHSYLYQIMDDINMPPSQREELMALAAQTRWDYFKKKSVDDYDRDSEWSDRYMLDQTLSYSSTQIESAEGIKRFLGLVGEILTSDWSKELRNARSSLELLVDTAQRKPDVLNVLRQNVPLLQDLRTKIESGETNQHQRQELLSYIDSAIDASKENG